MNMIRLIVAGIIYFAAWQASAQEPSFSFPVERGSVSLIGVSGNIILDRCTKQSDRDQEYCLAWMQLAADNAMQMKAIDPKLPLCIPQEVDATQSGHPT